MSASALNGSLRLLVDPPRDWPTRVVDPLGVAKFVSDRQAFRPSDSSLVVVDERQYLCAMCDLWLTGCSYDAHETIGCIGRYAAANLEAALFLLQRASMELARRGCTLAVGPMDGSTWDNYRLVVESSSEPRFFLEPHNPLDWTDHFDQAGFAPMAHYYSGVNHQISRADPELESLHELVQCQGIRVRPICMRNLDRELSQIYDLTIECFRTSLLFSPIPRELFIDEYQRLRDFVIPELVLLAEVDQQLVAFVFAIPDLLQQHRDAIIIKTLAVKTSMRGNGLGRFLVGQCHRIGHELGFHRAIHALMAETGDVRRLSEKSATPFRRYALYARSLDSVG